MLKTRKHAYSGSDSLMSLISAKPKENHYPNSLLSKATPKPTHCALKDAIRSRGIVLEYTSDIYPAPGCSTGGRIQVLPFMPAAAEFAVLVHEFAHELLHRGQRRTQTNKTVRETEAEAVSFVVCRAIGLDTNTAASDYIQLYQGDKDTLAESLAFIQQTAAGIISAITEEQREELVA